MLFGLKVFTASLTRALLHLAKHRGAGYLDVAQQMQEEENFDDDDTSKKKEKKLSPYELLPFYIQTFGAKTVGDYFHKRLAKSYKDNDPKTRLIRQRDPKKTPSKFTVDYAISRWLVKEEFHLFWDTQSTYYSALTPKLKKQVYDILFFERPKAPYACAQSSYIETENRLLKAHPLSEQRRIYESVNNIRINTLQGRRSLTLKERESIITELLYKAKKANKTSVAELLEIKKTDVVFSDGKTGIAPYLYSKPEFDFIKTIAFEKMVESIEFMANQPFQTILKGV